MYTEEKSDSCRISLINDTALVYESHNLSSDHDECSAEFSCPDGLVPEYSIQRFQIPHALYCSNFGYLGLYINDNVNELTFSFLLFITFYLYIRTKP